MYIEIYFIEKTHVKVEIICNWDEEISNARYMESNGTRKMQIFQVESKYGCVKLPQICEVLPNNKIEPFYIYIYNVVIINYS